MRDKQKIGPDGGIGATGTLAKGGGYLLKEAQIDQNRFCVLADFKQNKHAYTHNSNIFVAT